MLKLLSKLFPSKSEKDVQRIGPVVDEINKYFEQYQALSDDELKAKTIEFRQKITDATRDIEAEIAEKKERLKTDVDLSIEDHRQIATEIEEVQKHLDETTNAILEE